jgi:hypothetical protein
MWTKLNVAFGVVLLTAGAGAGAVGCSFTRGASDGAASAVTSKAFDKNHLLDDDVLMDDRAVTAAQIQTFLDRTPYGTQSPLATYRDDNGASAAALLHDAAVSYGVNPITLLVRIEMESGLVSGKAGATGPDAAAADSGLATPKPGDIQTKIDNAFNCGRVLGLEGQAGCATRAVARAMMLLEDGQEANGGWKRGVALTTQDNVTITPVNAATAAIYVYTPYVGESGGGAKGTAGASGHMALWDVFAKALKYKGATCPQDAGACATDDAGTDDTDGGSADIDAGDPDADVGDIDAGDPDSGMVDPGDASPDAGTGDAGQGGLERRTPLRRFRETTARTTTARATRPRAAARAAVRTGARRTMTAQTPATARPPGPPKRVARPPAAPPAMARASRSSSAWRPSASAAAAARSDSLRYAEGNAPRPHRRRRARRRCRGR